MNATTYEQRRDEIETYFDRTAAENWSRLTTDAPVGRIRQTVREGRDQMRATVLQWLPEDLSGQRVLDAGCGTGLFAFEAARRGANVVAMDLSNTLVSLAQERLPSDIDPARIQFKVGDMSTPGIGEFDHVVAMDSLIHYQLADAITVIEQMTTLAGQGVIFTFAPRTPLLGAMHAIGQLFPQGNRSPSIEPVAERALRAQLHSALSTDQWTAGRTRRVSRGFYTSQAFELVRM
ncbi:MAG: magnesium protoporphyrin IX methyltransferase [Pseudomonadota bacterium]